MADDQLDETDILFQEAFGARMFRRGKPRAVLEVKSADTSLSFHDARLRGYDRAKAAAESAKISGTKAERLAATNPRRGGPKDAPVRVAGDGSPPQRLSGGPPAESHQ
jgi:hypothetical protein